jgi:1-acyl-sn-glycerol-3-phosphate acyltransferase
MLKILRGPFLGVIAMLFWFLNTIVWMVFFFIIAIFKIFMPSAYLRRGCTGILDEIASHWMLCNNLMLNISMNVKWDVIGDVDLKINDWYLVISNHQSWADIVVLGQVLNRKIPLLKYFLKKELIYVPLLGFAWWALDYPFMKRFTKSELRKKPHLRGKDIETTRKACEKFKYMPISVMNFVEGTRLTAEKYQKQQSPYKHLLLPKAGGIAYTLQAMGHQLHQIIDVTIVYPKGLSSFWSLLSGKVRQVKIYLRQIPITDNLIGDYQNDKEFRKSFQAWLNSVWQEKDALLVKGLEG